MLTLLTLTPAALAVWPDIQTIYTPAAGRIVRQVTLAVDDTDPSQGWFLFDVFESGAAQQATLYGVTWTGTTFGTVTPVSTGISGAEKYLASVATFDDGTSDVRATARYTNGLFTQLETLRLPRGGGSITAERSIADDNAGSMAVGRNMVAADDATGMFGACWVEQCSTCKENSYANERDADDTGVWPGATIIADDLLQKEEHCTVAYGPDSGDLVYAWSDARDVRVHTADGDVTFTTSQDVEGYTLPAVAVTKGDSLTSGVETVQLVALNKDESPEKLVYWECAPSIDDCDQVSDWRTFSLAIPGIGRTQVAANDDGYLFASYVKKGGQNGDDRVRVTWVCPNASTFGDGTDPSVLVDGSGASSHDEAVVLTNLGEATHDGVAFNNIAVNEDTVGLYTGLVHVAYLADTSTMQGSSSWVAKVATRPFSAFGCP